MKKYLQLIAAMALVCGLPACRTLQEEQMPAQVQLKAVMEDQGETKTSLSQTGEGVSQVLWSEDDILSVFIDGSSTAETFTLFSGAGTKSATFHGKKEGSRYVAFYPSSMTPSLKGESIRFTLPVEQTYTAGSFGANSYPMTAVSGSNTLEFRNTAAVLRISLLGRHSVSRIVFRPKDPSVKVTGKATVSVSDPSNPVLAVNSDGCDSLVLNTGGLVLNQTTPTDFYLVLPPQTYKGGFNVRVYSGNRFMDKAYNADFTMRRSRLHKADPFTFQPNGMDESTYLEGAGVEGDPFLIQSLPDLILLRDAVKANKMIPTVEGQEVKAATAYYRLTTDISLSAVCSESAKKSWAPIGNSDSPFRGVFDGEGHSVEDLYIFSRSEVNLGLFGYVGQEGIIKGLSVSGKVSVTGGNGSIALIVGYLEGLVESCSSAGEVDTKVSSVGGVAGDVRGSLKDCTNRAKVTGTYYVGGVIGYEFPNGIVGAVNWGDVSGTNNVGGIAGISNGDTGNCVNYGTIRGTSRVGGIFGNNNAFDMENCRNEGPVTGETSVGGIAGYSRQNGCIVNCINRADIKGSGDFVGGICGDNSSSSSVRTATRVQNCVNTGKVSSSASSVGAIVGRNMGANGSDLASLVSQCYWLYDPAKGLGMKNGIGLDEGDSSALFALTQEQLRGAAYDGVLYGSYSLLIDALNAWADKNVGNYTTPLQGWKYEKEGDYPVLTGLKATPPGTTPSVFSLSSTSVEVLASASVTEVTVKSSQNYQVSYPDWITQERVQHYETDPYTHIHYFRIAENLDGNPRNGEVVFTNAGGEKLSLKVKQKGRYLDVDAESLIYSGEGGSRKFNISSSTAWVVESDAAWCTVAPGFGSGSGVVMVRTAANESASARSATVTVRTDDGTLVRTVGVVQSAAEEGGEGQEVDWTQYDFVHKSLVMRYTATWCGWCPRMNKTIHRAQELAPDAFNYMVLHDGGSDLQFSQATPLANQFGLSAFPTGMVDARIKVSNGDIEETAKIFVSSVEETVKTYGTITGADIRSTIVGRTVNVDVGVYAKATGQYKLTVLLLEDGIINPQTDYEEGDHARYVHDNVIRVAMSNVLGDAFTVSSAPSKQIFSYSTAVPESFELANMRVLVYIQRTYGSYPIIRSGNYGDYFVDNTATVEVGGNLKLALVGAPGGGGGGGSSQEGGDNEGITPGDDIDM